MMVFVYWNLHRKCWSVRCEKTRKVILHCRALALESVTFKVSEAGRQRVLRERRKNVHAGCRGYLASYLMAGWDNEPENWRRPQGPLQQLSGIFDAVTYNPYKYETFVRRKSEKPIHSSRYVALTTMIGEDRPCVIADVG